MTPVATRPHGNHARATTYGAGTRIPTRPKSAPLQVSVLLPAPRVLIHHVLVAFHKPYGVISQFSEEHSGQETLAEFGFPSGIYPLGRLDSDSEGLLLLSDEPGLNSRLLNPSRGHRRRYWVQIEGIPSADALHQLARGVVIRGYRTLPARVQLLDPAPALPDRQPTIRFRKNIPTSWLQIELVEGKNRQVRRMTAVVGHPTLRLVRVGIGAFALGTLSPGTWRALSSSERQLLFE
jgi:23S rRNA pseudouridine2457 synthase